MIFSVDAVVAVVAVAVVLVVPVAIVVAVVLFSKSTSQYNFFHQKTFDTNLAFLEPTFSASLAVDSSFDVTPLVEVNVTPTRLFFLLLKSKPMPLLPMKAKEFLSLFFLLESEKGRSVARDRNFFGPFFRDSEISMRP